MGVEVGQDHFWVVIRLFAKKHSFPLYVDKVYGDWEVLNELCEQFKVQFCVVDALPDTRGTRRYLDRAMHGRHHTYAFLCYYQQNGTEHLWDWGMDAKITAVRTLSLDEMFDGFRRRRTLLPAYGRELAHGLYYEHLQALVRTTEPDDFGQPVPAYRHTRPDDLRACGKLHYVGRNPPRTLEWLVGVNAKRSLGNRRRSTAGLPQL
jgi:hypothetical protein